ncbi:MAG: sensor histidine kinase [Lewinellaceae bacterium]|nr:sensor histidine kinase [Phaeodactylibacter sp.]MCB9349074.1 sensor histidine kinase [Lewinellaceae bacterium]
MTLTRAQAKLYRILRKDIIQHLMFGATVLIVVFCYLAIHAWYQGKAELLETFGYKREAFFKVFREALGYTLLLGLPVYFNLFFVYQERLQTLLGRSLFPKARLKDWSFYLFLFLSSITALVFSLLYAPFIRAAFDIVNQEWYELTIVILFFILCTTGVSYTKQAIERGRELERKARLEAYRRRREAERELHFIKKQIRPHFLFNTLANLQVLAHRKSEYLPGLIGELSRLLRYLVYQTNEKLVPLEDELRFIKSYMELQRLQLSKHTKFEYELKGEVLHKHRIPPMVLLLFVENCFKHYGGNPVKSKFIRVRFEVEHNHFCARISNSYKANFRNEDTMAIKPGKGVGLRTAVENLDLIYKKNYTLDITAEEGVYSVLLQVPLG